MAGIFDFVGDILGFKDAPPYPDPSGAETELLGVQTDYYRQMLEQSQQTRGMLEEYLQTPSERVRSLERQIEEAQTGEWKPAAPERGAFEATMPEGMGGIVGALWGRLAGAKSEEAYEAALKEWEGLDVPDVGDLEAQLGEARGQLERAESYERVGMLGLERYESALKGELPLPEKFEAQQEEALGMLEEKLSRQGAGPGSTPYIQAMGEFERTWGERADLLKRGEISAAYGPMFGQQQLGMQKQEAGYGQLYGMGGYGSGLMGQGTGLLGYYGGERQAQYGGQYNQAMMQNQWLSSLLGGGMSMYGGYLGGSAMGAAMAASDKKLKKNITYLKPIECERGLILPCVFQYVWDTVKWHIGVIAQDLQKVYPEFVKQMEGYLAVDYGGLSQKLIGDK